MCTAASAIAFVSEEILANLPAHHLLVVADAPIILARGRWLIIINSLAILSLRGLHLLQMLPASTALDWIPQTDIA